MANAIGTGAPVIDGVGHGRLEPPPPGLAYVHLVGGPVAHVDVGLSRRMVDRGALDQRFGSSRPLPRVDHDRTYVLAYDVSVAGAPARCSVFGHFDDEPAAATVEASSVTLRIDLRFAGASPGSP